MTKNESPSFATGDTVRMISGSPKMSVIGTRLPEEVTVLYMTKDDQLKTAKMPAVVLMHEPVGRSPRWYRHKDLGTEVMVYGSGKYRADGDPNEAVVVLFRADDGSLGVVPYGEFHDGRYEQMTRR